MLLIRVGTDCYWKLTLRTWSSKHETQPNNFVFAAAPPSEVWKAFSALSRFLSLLFLFFWKGAVNKRKEKEDGKLHKCPRVCIVYEKLRNNIISLLFMSMQYYAHTIYINETLRPCSAQVSVITIIIKNNIWRLVECNRWWLWGVLFRHTKIEHFYKMQFRCVCCWGRRKRKVKENKDRKQCVH
jgi:hypothetical protein